MKGLWQDVRYGVRTLLQQPGFTLVALVTLALGIGANTAIFSVVNAVLLRPLSFKQPEQVLLAWNKGAEAAGGDRTPLAVADLLDWRAQNHSFEGIAAFQDATLNFTGGDVPEQVRAVTTTANLLSVLGTNVQVGRDFQAADEQLGAPRVVLLSDRFWRSHFGADPQVVGRAIKINGVDTSIVGVMSPNLDFPNRGVDLWRAIQLQQPTRRGPYFLTGVGRLRPGVTLEQARADSKTMTSSFDRGNFTFNLLPANEFIVGDVRPALLVLLAAVTLVLLIAAVNVANLTLARAASRAKEISIRTALGASRWRIVRRLLTESLLLAVAGGAVGILCALWGVALLVKFAPENLPRVDQIRIDWVALLWTALVSTLTGLVFGLVPAWQSSRENLNEVLRDGGRSMTEGVARRRGRSVLVVAELALAVMLVTGAGLLIKSLWRLQQVDLGIKPAGVLTMRYALRGQRYQERASVREFAERLVEQARVLPGVDAAALTNSLPPDQTEFSSDFTIEGRTPSKDLPQIAYFNRISPDYLKALAIPVLSGRSFSNADVGGSIRVVLINATLQRRFFPGEDPVGKRINLSSEGEPDWTQVVGVVGDVKYNGVADDVQPAIYQPVAQEPIWDAALLIKTNLADPRSLASALRNEVHQLDPDVPLTQVATMDQRVSAAVAQPRFRTTLIALFAVVALLLACVGIYGVISYSVTQRTHEIGIRMALGARTSDVLSLVIGHAILLAGIGVALGLTASYGLTSLLSTLLFGVKPTDPAIFIATAILLAATALLASYLPARRATRVDPLVALRYE